MPFEIAETESKANMPPTALISYMRPKPRKGAGGGPAYDRTKVKPRLTITVPTTIIGVAKSKCFVLMLGTGADSGKARLKGVKEGTRNAAKPTEFKSVLILRFGHVPKLGDEIFDGERCEVKRISDEEYELAASCLKPLGER